MGSGSNTGISSHDLGIIPRVVRDIFVRIESLKQLKGIAVEVSVTYLEIYQEELKDLLHPTTSLQQQPFGKGPIMNSNGITIREESTGGVILLGVKEESIQDYAGMMRCLTRGSVTRTTGSTLMNEHSSRSHSIFTITIVQRKPSLKKAREEITRSKFHLVDRQRRHQHTHIHARYR